MLYMQHNEAGTVWKKMHMIQQSIKIRGPRIDDGLFKGTLQEWKSFWPSVSWFKDI